MNITTTYKTNNNGRGQIVARGLDTQKTTSWDQSKSTDWNHGTAAGALIIAYHAKQHPLTQQNGDDVRGAVVRSLDAGFGSHTSNDSGTVHRFDI